MVPVYDLGSVDGVPYIAMRLIEGPSLAEVVARGPLERAASGRADRAGGGRFGGRARAWGAASRRQARQRLARRRPRLRDRLRRGAPDDRGRAGAGRNAGLPGARGAARRAGRCSCGRVLAGVHAGGDADGVGAAVVSPLRAADGGAARCGDPRRRSPRLTPQRRGRTAARPLEGTSPRLVPPWRSRASTNSLRGPSATIPPIARSPRPSSPRSRSPPSTVGAPHASRSLRPAATSLPWPAG